MRLAGAAVNCLSGEQDNRGTLPARAMRTPVPKYLTIKAVLGARLDREYAPGQRLPSEPELCRQFGVSRITIQQSLALLAKEGRINRQQGRGTFYVGPGPAPKATKPSELLESVMRREGFTRVVRQGVIATPPWVATRLQLGEGAPQVVTLDRVGFLDDEPLVFIRGWLPLSLGVHVLDAGDALRHTTVASLLRDRHGVPIEAVVQTIAAGLADATYATELGVEVGAPVLEGERTYLDAQGRPVFFSITFYRADRHRFMIRLQDWRGGWDDSGDTRPR
jgi:GntR family transcriptional regulator